MGSEYEQKHMVTDSNNSKSKEDLLLSLSNLWDFQGRKYEYGLSYLISQWDNGVFDDVCFNGIKYTNPHIH